MKCPLCDNVNTSMLCPNCGFDSSKDCERYPTLGMVGKGKTVAVLRQEWQKKQLTELSAGQEPKIRTASKAEIAARLQDRRKISVEKEFPPRRREPKKRKLLPLLIAAAFALTLGLGVWIGSGLGSGTPAQPGESQQVQEPVQSEQMNVTPEEQNGSAPAVPENPDTVYRIAMITDYGDITDQSYNQATYEACKAFAEDNRLDYAYYRPAADVTAARVSMVDSAIMDGYNVIVLPGFAFGETLAEVADDYPDVKFVALDVAEGEGGFTATGNVFSAVYREELAGYMAGYAAVKIGYRHLGFLGAMPVPGIMRYGYGYLQGIDAAARELDIVDQIKVEYVYANQFYGNADITAVMETWYRNMGVEVVFACGGGISYSAADAAARIAGKVIGADIDQAGVIDSMYGEGMTVTSAVKGLAPTVNDVLTAIVLEDNWDSYAGRIESLGLVSTDPESNYVQLPMESTQWCDSFTQDDYKTLVGELLEGTRVVSADLSTFVYVDVAVEIWPNIYS